MKLFTLLIVIALALPSLSATVDRKLNDGEGGDFCKSCVDSGKADCRYVSYDGAKDVLSFSCVCKDAYIPKDSACVDYDECEANVDNCDTHAICTNADPGYSCACEEGFDDTSGEGKTGISCTDIDECKTGANICGSEKSIHSVGCKNEPGDYSCICEEGYEHASNCSKTCEDIDECADGTYDCQEHSHCHNTAGSYKCACDKGYIMDNGTCVDYDECEGHHNVCDMPEMGTGKCINNEGAYGCECLDGFTHTNGSETECINLNECSIAEAYNVSLCTMYADCIDTAGSFYCKCFYGYTGIGRYTEDGRYNCTEADPSREDLMQDIHDAKKHQKELDVKKIYAEAHELESKLELVKRLCKLRMSGHMERMKREVISDEMEDPADGELALTALVSHNHNLELEIALWKRRCGLMN